VLARADLLGEHASVEKDGATLPANDDAGADRASVHERERPISLSLLLATAALLILMTLPNLRKARQSAFQEEET